MDDTGRAKLYNLCDPDEPLEPTDERYVVCDEVRHSEGLLDDLGESIRLSDEPTCQFLSGHRGCGKTSELYGLRQLLSANSEYFVVYCESHKYLELNDTMEYTDVLLAIVQQVAQEAERHSISVETNWMMSLLRDVWDSLSTPVQLKDTKVKTGLLEFGFELKHNPNYRQMVRDRLRPQATAFLQEVNKILEKAVSGFRKSDANCRGLVVIVDNLDRMYRRQIPDTRDTSYDQLFRHAATQLKEVACHTIYTLPPSFLHSAGGSHLPALYDTDPQMLPMVPVAMRDGNENEEGIAKLMEIVSKRIAVAAAENVFDAEETLRRLCAASGGYVRYLVSLLQSAIRKAKGTISLQNVEQAIRQRRELMARGLAQSQWDILREVAQTHKIGKTEECLQLLDSLAVLEYRDERDVWYDVNPILREAKEFVV